MSSTTETIAAILELLRERPETKFHPSLFTYGCNTYRAGMPHAIRKLMAAGMLQVAYRNIEKKPVYERGPNWSADVTAAMI